MLLLVVYAYTLFGWLFLFECQLIRAKTLGCHDHSNSVHGNRMRIESIQLFHRLKIPFSSKEIGSERGAEEVSIDGVKENSSGRI